MKGRSVVVSWSRTWKRLSTEMFYIVTGGLGFVEGGVRRDDE